MKDYKIRKIRSVSKGSSEVFFSDRKSLVRADSYNRIEEHLNRLLTKSETARKKQDVEVPKPKPKQKKLKRIRPFSIERKHDLYTSDENATF